MKLVKFLLCLAIVAALAFGIYKLASHGGKADAADEDKEGPAEVQMAKIERKTITEPQTVYGSVIAQPARVQVIAAAFETRVSHVLVAPGQIVKSGDPLVEIQPSAAAELQLRQAMNAAAAAKRDLDQTRSRFDMKLATNQDLGAAEKASNDAQLQLTSFQQSGLGTDNRLRAIQDGIIAKVDAQSGQVVPSGGPLVETVAADDIEAKLGVEAEDLDVLKEDTEVEITPVSGGSAVKGKVRLITHRTNTDTRLVDVYVSLPTGSGLLLDSYVKGTFQKQAPDALAAPRDAVESDEDGYCVFTVADKKAVRQAVEPGLENNAVIQITGTGIKEGQTVVTVGSRELKDGDEVAPAGETREQ